MAASELRLWLFNVPKFSLQEHGYSDNSFKCVTNKPSGQLQVIFALAFPISECPVEVNLIKRNERTKNVRKMIRNCKKT